MSMTAIIIALATLISALASLVTAIHTRKQLMEVHHQINSRFDQFIEITRKSSHAEGVKDEQNRMSGQKNTVDDGTRPSNPWHEDPRK